MATRTPPTAPKTAVTARPAGAKTAPVKKPAATPAAKTGKALKAPATKPVKAAKLPKPEKAAKTEKPKKPKLVRDSFTIPKNEYEQLETLKARAVHLKQPTKKSELLRAGVKLLSGLSDAAFLAAIEAVPTLKTGRPNKTSSR